MDHPFVVKLHYAFQTKNKIYLIVDLMAGVIKYFIYRDNYFIYYVKKKDSNNQLLDFMQHKYYLHYNIYIQKKSYIVI